MQHVHDQPDGSVRGEAERGIDGKVEDPDVVLGGGEEPGSGRGVTHPT